MNIRVNPEQIDRYFFPVNVHQIEDLLGKVLTQIEAMNLREGVEKANKDMARQTLWSWWGSAQDNSLTSSMGCIAPIKAPNSNGKHSDTPHYWLTVHQAMGCPNGCTEANRNNPKGEQSSCSECPPKL